MDNLKTIILAAIIILYWAHTLLTGYFGLGIYTHLWAHGLFYILYLLKLGVKNKGTFSSSV